MPDKAIYISGPMRGIPHFNFPAFDRAALRWRMAGWQVFNPADGGHGSGDPETGTGVTEEEIISWLREDLRMISQCHAVALLPGWEESDGAQFEAAVGYKLGLKFYDAETMVELEVEQDEVLA